MTSSNKSLRTCAKGHKYYKSSDCPTCPICEKELKPATGFLSILSAPARRALENNGILLYNSCPPIVKMRSWNFMVWDQLLYRNLERLWTARVYLSKPYSQVNNFFNPLISYN